MAPGLGKSRLRNLNTQRRLLRRFVQASLDRFPLDRTVMVVWFHNRLEALNSVRAVVDEMVERTLKVGVGETKVFVLNDADLRLHLSIGYCGEVSGYVTMEWGSSAYPHAYLNLLLDGLGIYNHAANPFALSQVRN